MVTEWKDRKNMFKNISATPAITNVYKTIDSVYLCSV